MVSSLASGHSTAAEGFKSMTSVSLQLSHCSHMLTWAPFLLINNLSCSTQLFVGVVKHPSQQFSDISRRSYCFLSINLHSGDFSVLLKDTTWCQSTGLEVIKLFSCSTQLSMKIKLLIITDILTQNWLKFLVKIANACNLSWS